MYFSIGSHLSVFSDVEVNSFNKGKSGASVQEERISAREEKMDKVSSTSRMVLRSG